jgi:hypothetical protein
MSAEKKFGWFCYFGEIDAPNVEEQEQANQPSLTGLGDMSAISYAATCYLQIVTI